MSRFIPLAEPETVLLSTALLVPRLAAARTRLEGFVRLHFHARGALSNLFLEPLEYQSVSELLATSEVLMRVLAVGLNFRDVLNVLGEYPGDPGPPGLDCSGVTSAFGERVRHLGPALGATCFGFAFGSLASSARTDAGLLVRKPPHLSHEEACSLPITFSTVRNSPTLSHAYAPRLQCTHAQRGTLDPTMRISCC